MIEFLRWALPGLVASVLAMSGPVALVRYAEAKGHEVEVARLVRGTFGLTVALTLAVTIIISVHNVVSWLGW